jgi:hypothetical protein
MSEIAVFPLPAKTYSCRAFMQGAGKREARQVIPPCGSQQISDDLKVSNRRPVYTDVDL